MDTEALTIWGFAWAPEGDGLYAIGEAQDGREGIWFIPLSDGPPELIVLYDNVEPGYFYLDVKDEYVYFSLQEIQSDIWMLELSGL